MYDEISRKMLLWAHAQVDISVSTLNQDKKLKTRDSPPPGQKPSGDDGAERARGGVPVRGSGLAADRAAEPGDAAASLQLPLSRAQARGDRRQRRLHQA